ncbi:MAG: opuBA [Gammaproteobacteria bacterium]|jgi:putative ABC transport system ATP-binding protein|nr:opuBA [Gammaproteobacteria bacterium]
MLSVKKLSLKFSDHQVLSDINLEIQPGELIIILGSNGSGKSSLLKLIDRRYAIQQGSIILKDKPLEKYSPESLSQHIVTLTQNPLDSLFPNLTVEENCRLAIRRAKSKIIPNDYLAEFNPKLEKHKKNLAGQLSGGEQQSLALALACLAEPEILLLDEHTSALDPHTADRLMRMTVEKIKAHNMTCLLTTHHLEFAKEYGSRLIALRNGKITHDFSYPEKTKLTIEDLKKECYGA